MSRLSTLGAMFLVLQGGPAPADPQEPPARGLPSYGKQLAVIVGINYGGTDNKDFVSKLKNAENDAKAVHKVLTESYGYKPENIKLLTGPEATKLRIEEAMDDITPRATAEDSFLFYFSGHGERPEDGFGRHHGLFVPFDAKAIELDGRPRVKPRSSYEFEGLTRDLSYLKARHTLILLDCCYSGTIFGTTRGEKGLKLDRPFDREGFEAKGIQAMTAGLSIQRVDDGQGKHSPFTQALLDALEEIPGTIPEQAKSFTADMLFDAVKKGMTRLMERTEGAKRAHPLFGTLPLGDNSDVANFHFFADMAALRKRVSGPASKDPLAQPLRFDIQSMTGLTGQWWFEETPWLTPTIRAALDLDSKVTMLRLDDRPGVVMRGPDAKPLSAFLDPDIDQVHRLLREHIKRTHLPGRDDPASALIRDLLERPEEVENRDLDDGVRSLQVALKDADVHDRPTDRHLLAVLLHRLNRSSEALDAYDKAIAAYGKATRLKPLQALCVADLGRFLLNSKRYAEAIARFQEAEELSGRQPTVLYLDCLCNRSEAHRRLGQSEQAQKCLTEAVALLNKAQLQPDHPLRAFVLETFAWFDFEIWWLGDAIKFFEQAALVFRDTPDPWSINDQAQITRFRILHGRAMAERYAGNLPGARVRFEAIESGIRALIKERSKRGTLSPMVKQALLDREVNTKERWAESYLFHGNPAKAARILQDALMPAKDLAPGRREAVLFQLYVKRAIALALERRGADAREALNKAGNQRLVLRQFRDLQTVQELAEALTQSLEVGIGQPLREFLAQQMPLDEKGLKGLRRDDLEVLLLANATFGVDAVTLANIDRLLGTVRAGRNDFAALAFARPYYDAVIRWLAKRGTEDPGANELLSKIFLARSGEELDSTERFRAQNSLIFHLEPDNSFGLAILYPRDGDPVVSTFPFSLRDGKQRPSETPLPPPWDKAFQEQLQKAEGRIAVYWEDPVLELRSELYPFDFPAKQNRDPPVPADGVPHGDRGRGQAEVLRADALG